MPIRNRPQRSYGRRPSNKSWAGANGVGHASVGVSTKVLLGSFTLSNPNIDETILRTVGRISVSSDQTASTENQIGAFGLIVVNDLAVAAGAASIPGPVTDVADDGWFIYVPITHEILVATAVGIVNSVDYDFDSKGKRKVQEGFSIAIMVENISAAFAFRMNFTMRLLSMIS